MMIMMMVVRDLRKVGDIWHWQEQEKALLAKKAEAEAAEQSTASIDSQLSPVC